MGRRIYLHMRPLQEAREIFLNHWDYDAWLEPEVVKTVKAVGRVTAAPVFARFSMPTFHAAAMDGIAVKAAATFGAAPERPRQLRLGEEAVWINTGQPLPAGYDAVIMVEHLHQADPETVEIQAAAFPWQHVRKVGEDVVATELLLPENHLVRPYDLGGLLAAGIVELQVKRRPRVLVIPTGDELLELEAVREAKALPAGKVIESNSWVLAELIRQWGAECDRHPILADDYQLLRQAVADALDQGYHLVVINAGSSAGSADHTANLVEELGKILVHGVGIMPGKPTVLGEVRGRPVVGNPGYPVSAVISLEQFVRPFLCRFLGVEEPEEQKIKAYPAQKLPSKLGVEEFIRVNLGQVGDRVVATPLPRGAASVTSLMQADGFLRIPENAEGVTEEEACDVTLVTAPSQVRHRVVLVGSHDLTLDVLANLAKKRFRGMTLASTNAGSLGGLLALRRGHAHAAGSHLLDTDTGEYNVSYVQRYLPGVEVQLVTLAYRQQGLMVAPGNPKKIRGLADLGRGDVRFVNRQPGSGTRILLDWELQRLGLRPEQIDGYQSEEYTHMAVAVAVLSGRADAGMGIFAAARALGLDFLPVATERYDLVIPAAHVHTELVQRLLELVHSGEFRREVEKLGGYDLKDTGRILSVSTD